MKKIMTVLAVLFVFAATTFGQTNIVKNTTFMLNNGSTLTENLSVAVFPSTPGYPEEGGEMVITFDNIVDFTSVNENGAMDFNTPTELALENGAAYAIKFDYNSLVTGTVLINYNSNTVYEFFTKEDTLSAYENGEVVGYTDGHSEGFIAGVESVPEVDTMSIWSNGYDSGVVEGENTSSEDAYNAGYTDGTNSSTGINDFAVTNLNVYPNPANTSGTVTIDCDDFNNVKVLTITGQEIFSSTSNILNVSDFTTTTGYYVLVIEDMGFNVTNKKLLVK